MTLSDAQNLVIDYETLVKRTNNDVGQRDNRRKTLKKKLDTIMFDPGMAIDARRAFSTRKKTLGDDLPKALGDSELDAAELAISKLAGDVTDRDQIIAARTAANTDLAAARAAFAKARSNLDQGSFTLLETRLANCVKAIAAAAKKADFTSAGQLAKDYLTTCTDAVAYAADYDGWNAKITIYIAKEITTPVDKQTLETLRDTLMAAAAKLAEKGKFADARNKLDEFKNDGLVTDKAKLTDAGSFAAKLLDFKKNHEARFDAVIAAKVPDANAHKNDVKSATNKGLTNKDYATAVTMFDAIILWYPPREAYAAKLAGFDQKLNKHSAFRDTLKDAKKEYDAGNFAQAVTVIDGLDPAIAAEGEVHKRIKQMKPQYEAVHAILTGVEQATLKTDWDAAEKLAKDAHSENGTPQRAQLFKDAKDKLDVVAAQLIQGELVELYAQVKPILTAHATAAGYGYLTGYDNDKAAGKYADAKAKLQTAVPLVKQLVPYLEVKQRAEDVKKALPSSAVDLIKRIDDAVLAAEDEASKNSNPAKAAAGLRALLNETDFESLASDIMDFQTLLKRIAARQARVLNLMELAAPKKALTDGLDHATALADPGGDFAGAYAALTTHADLLTKAQEYAAIRQQTLGVTGALERSVKQDPTREAKIFNFGMDLNAVKAALAKAEIDAGKADFDEALKKFRKLLKDCEKMTAECAKIYEADDHKNSNAGHSLDRHGPGLTEDQLIHRLKTGIAPDGLSSPTGASSKFRSMEDWLAGREIGAKRAKVEKNVDVEMTEILPPFDPTKEPLPASFTIDHGKPIDEAYVGVKKTDVVNAGDGTINEGKFYESFEKMTGLTRSLVSFTWEYDPIAGYTFDVKGDGSNLKPQNNDEYIAEYKKATTDVANPNGKVPTRIPGRYVMMQQFPVAEDWDEELQQYT